MLCPVCKSVMKDRYIGGDPCGWWCDECERGFGSLPEVDRIRKIHDPECEEMMKEREKVIAKRLTSELKEKSNLGKEWDKEDVAIFEDIENGVQASKKQFRKKPVTCMSPKVYDAYSRWLRGEQCE